MSKAYDVASVDDIPEGKHLLVEVHGREIGIFNVKGQYYALPNVCFHQNGPLCQGAVSGTLVSNADTDWKRTWAHDGEIIVCPWHSMEFNIMTGASLAYPTRKLPTYRVVVEGQRINVYI